jgi:hypothetical protein
VRVVGDLEIDDTTADALEPDRKRALTRADASAPFETVVHVKRADERTDLVGRLRGDG